MFPRGIIYDRKRKTLHGSVNLQATLKQVILYSFIRGIGSGLIAFAVVAVLFMYWPMIQAEINYKLHPAGASVAINLVDLAKAQRIAEIQKETADLGLSSAFSMYIPKIGAKANITANVDAGNETAYLEALSHGVAHAAGTNFPGQGKTIFLFAHSTDAPWNVERFNAVFYLLKDLSAGDKITVYFADNRYDYEVTGREIVAANDTSFFTAESGERLILQTCYPPGTTSKRLLVIAEPME